MFWFALRKYLTYSVAIISIMAIGTGAGLSVSGGEMENVADTVSRAVVWGGFFGFVYTHFWFSGKKIWPLFDNLQIHRYAPMAVGYVILLVLSAFLRWTH